MWIQYHRCTLFEISHDYAQIQQSGCKDGEAWLIKKQTTLSMLKVMEKIDRFTLKWFLHHTCKGDWLRNLSNVPEFDIGKLKYYLTDSRNKTFDKEAMRPYKSLKAGKFYWGGVCSEDNVTDDGERFPREDWRDDFNGTANLQAICLPKSSWKCPRWFVWLCRRVRSKVTTVNYNYLDNTLIRRGSKLNDPP